MHFLRQSTPEQAEQTHLAWAELPFDIFSPVGLFLTLRACDRKPCLLESANGPEQLTRFSFIGIDPVARFTAAHDGIRLEHEGGEEMLQGDVLSALREVHQRYRLGDTPVEHSPFSGGWVGSLSYEWAGILEPRAQLPTTTLVDNPYARFLRFDTLVIFDHARKTIVLSTACRGGSAEYAQAQSRLCELAEQLEQPAPQRSNFELLDTQARSSMTQEEYIDGVQRLRSGICNGDIFQAVLSRRFERSYRGDPFTIYRALRIANPAPHMFYFEDQDLRLIGSSPERLISVRDRQVHSCPIAGTRPRHPDREQDDRLAQELCQDQKERAEHDMLVDLARNDLGRVAAVGSVKVYQHAQLEKFAKVQHLVSRVSCGLDASKDALDALAASFPAGTVSGAPKIRAMQLVAEIENLTRDSYAGCFGYLDHHGGLDMAINIRTVCAKSDRLFVQAGAGIVHDSDPLSEFQETQHKAQALLDAIELANTATFCLR